jgi:hypothetical protein
METTFGFENYDRTINLEGLIHEHALIIGYNGLFYWFHAVTEKIEALKNV